MTRALPLTHPACLIATWFGVGLLPRAPGTWGSLAALPFAYGLQVWGGAWAVVVACLVIAALGWWAIGRYLQHSAEADPAVVVVDEVAGQWLAVAPAATDPLLFAAGFVLFRLFDIAKVWPCNRIDSAMPGAAGVLADDLVAGAYAAAGVVALAWFLGRGG